MKKPLSIFKRVFVSLSVVLPMITGVLLLNLGNGIRQGGGLGIRDLSMSIEQEAFNGRESNYTEDTGFNEPSSVGAVLQEPTAWTDTWIDDFAGVGMTAFTSFNGHTGYSMGDYRYSTANGSDGTVIATGRGTSALNPWIISTPQEFAFWARYISLANSAVNAGHAYVNAPYFQLGADIDLTGKRWVTPFFQYPTNDVLTTSLGAGTPNRIYFDGNGFTIRNAYVKQSYNASAYSAYPSIFGRLTPKAQVKDLNIENAYISEGATPESAAVISQNTANYDASFINISVQNSIVRGSGGYGVNGIAAYAAVIKDCSVSDTTFICVPVITTTASYARGIGQAAEFIGNTVARSSLEINNHGYVAYAMGIGSILASTAYANTAPFGDREYALGDSFTFKGGFFGNTVEDSKISVTSDSTPLLSNGNAYNYGYASGIGYCNVNTKIDFDKNTLSNSIVSVKIDNNPITTEAWAVGMLYASFNANASTRVMELTNNAVLNSTISVVTQATTTTASGMFYVNSEYIDSRIRQCYTENTDVISRNYKQSSSVSSYASGINVGFATVIEDCVVGSGNIEARNEKYTVFAYGIGSTLGKNTLVGPTGLASLDRPYGRHYFDAGSYIGNEPVTNIRNCYNFSNITTSTTSTIYAAGIGMAEGFTNCVNYGNVMGNYVGGIAVGFEHTPNNVPTSANPAYASYNAIRPLIITNCVNYGNLIKAANNITSIIGGMFATYWNSLNYQRQWTISGVTYNDDINGKHLEVTNCISAGKPYFYVVQQDYSYKLTDNFSEVAIGTMFYGAIYGRILINPHLFIEAQPYDEVLFAEFLNERFVISDNFYSESACFVAEKWNYAAGIREIGTTYNSGTVNEVANLTEYRYVAERPSSYYYASEMGIVYNSSTISSNYGYNNGANAAVQRERIYNQIAKNWTNNLVFDSFDDVNTELNAAGYDTSSKQPQLANASYPFQILAYDRYDAAQGNTPNVSIKRLNANQMAGTETIAFKIDEFRNPQTGKSVENWYMYNGLLSTDCPTNTIVNLYRVNNLAVFILFANVIDTKFVINFETKADYAFTAVSSVVIGDTAGLEVEYTNSTGNAIDYTAVIWLAKNRITGEYEEFYAEYFYSNNNIAVAGTKMFTYNLVITDSFITKYALGTLGNYSFEITAIIAADAIYNIDILLPSGAGNEIGVNWEVLNSDSVVNVLDGSLITLTAYYDSEIYEFGQFVIDGVDDCYILVTNDVYSSVVSVQVIDEIYSITFTLNPKKYDINIRTFVFTSGNMRVELDNSGLIESNSEALEQAAFVTATNVGLKVADFYEDVNGQCYYKFVRWEYVGEGGITVPVNTSSLLLSSFNAALIKRNLQTSGGDITFVLVAVYQRQVQLVIDMYMPGYDNSDYNNLFEIFNGNVSLGQFSGHGDVIVDENILLRIEFTPDTRLAINEIDGIAFAARNDFSNNALFLALNTFRVVNVTLTLRPATILLYTKKAHESVGFEGGLILSTVTVNDADLKVDLLPSAYDVEISLDYAMLSIAYRFISLGIKYSNSDTLYEFTLSSTYKYNLVIDDDFFKDFVNTDGKCEIWLNVAAVYEVEISSSLSRTAGYEYADGIGNSFTLYFTDAVTGAAVTSEEEGLQEVNGFKFILDYNTKISYVYTQGDFSTFDVIGLSEIEKADKSVIITSPRQIAFEFLLNQYTLSIAQAGNGRVTINDSYTRTFELDSVITFSCDVETFFFISNIKINGRTLQQLGAVLNGNTVTIEVTPDFIYAVDAITNPSVALTVDIATQISTTIVAGVGGGGTAVVVLFVVILLLILRSKRINKQRLAAEAKAREYEQKFNVGSFISDLKK